MKEDHSVLISKPLIFALTVAIAGCSAKQSPDVADGGESSAPLAALDKDGDGRISGREAPTDILLDWKKLDANADGFIDKEEQKGVRRQPGGPPSPGQSEKPKGPSLDQLSVVKGASGDGRLSKAEAPEEMRQRFDILDRDRNTSPAKAKPIVQYAGARPDNILLLIVDDWGIDSSPIDNTAPPAAFLPNMPNLQALAAGGLRFTNAYAQPTCSPTRATLMTGRHPHQTTVFRAFLPFPPSVPPPPENVNVSSAAETAPPKSSTAASPPFLTPVGTFSATETTLPEAFTAAGSPYAMALIGKSHLGGGNNGYSVTGGWPEFYGLNGASVLSYFSWAKNTNGTIATSSTYTTTDQVNEAVAFIDRSETAGDPWFCWVAFNAPHSPYHVPPEGLAPPGGYSRPATGNADLDHFILMLEALDTELGRLLEAVDRDVTNIILIGDNGTPRTVIQEPFGKGHFKDHLYEAGIHVPMVVNGPAVTVPAGSTTEKLVHVIDLYSTILELAGIDPSAVAPADAVAQSKSIVPILSGTDTTDRYIVSEHRSGRAIRLDDFPEYKLIINGDPLSPSDIPTFEFFNIGAPAYDVNEQSPLNIPGLTGTALDAFHACFVLDAAIGGGYNAP